MRAIGGSMDQLGTLSICYDIIIGLLATGTSGSPNFGRPLLKHGRKFGAASQENVRVSELTISCFVRSHIL